MAAKYKESNKVALNSAAFVTIVLVVLMLLIFFG